MELTQTFELSMVVDKKHFQKVFSRVCNSLHAQKENEEEWVDLSLQAKGIIVIYRNSLYKKKIRLIVIPDRLLEDASHTDKLLRKLDKRITDYFNHKYCLDDFTLSGMNLSTGIDVGIRENVRSYIKVIQRIGRVNGFSPSSYDSVDDDSNFYLEGNSSGIAFLLYDLKKVSKDNLISSGISPKKVKLSNNQRKGILRAEVRLTKPKAIRAYTDAGGAAGQLAELLQNSQDIFPNTFTQIISPGNFHKKKKAVEIIHQKVKDKVMKRKMLRLLTLVPEKKSLYLAQKAMNCRDMDKVMDAFAKIGLSPVTISKRQDVKFLSSIYSYSI